MGHNYFKSLFAVGFQGMLIMVCMAIYAVLVQGIAAGGDMMGPSGPVWVHGAVVFRSLQDREPLEIHMGRSLKYRCKICC